MLPDFENAEEVKKENKELLVDKMAKFIRQLWINAVRAYEQARTHKPCYYNSSPRWDGGSDAYGRKYAPIWPKIAQIVIDEKLIPHVFIAVQFIKCKHDAPVPTILLSNSALSKYHKAEFDFPKETRYHLELQNIAAKQAIDNQLRIGVDENIACSKVVMDTHISLSALYRYSLAFHNKLMKAADFWKEDAIKQYISMPYIYDEVWGKLIPYTIRQLIHGPAEELDYAK